MQRIFGVVDKDRDLEGASIDAREVDRLLKERTAYGYVGPYERIELIKLTPEIATMRENVAEAIKYLATEPAVDCETPEESCEYLHNRLQHVTALLTRTTPTPPQATSVRDAVLEEAAKRCNWLVYNHAGAPDTWHQGLIHAGIVIRALKTQPPQATEQV